MLCWRCQDVSECAQASVASHGEPAFPWAQKDLTGHVMHKLNPDIQLCHKPGQGSGNRETAKDLLNASGCKQWLHAVALLQGAFVDRNGLQPTFNPILIKVSVGN